jgi:hypothetical protein
LPTKVPTAACKPKIVHPMPTKFMVTLASTVATQLRRRTSAPAATRRPALTHVHAKKELSRPQMTPANVKASRAETLRRPSADMPVEKSKMVAEITVRASWHQKLIHPMLRSAVAAARASWEGGSAGKRACLEALTRTVSARRGLAGSLILRTGLGACERGRENHEVVGDLQL